MALSLKLCLQRTENKNIGSNYLKNVNCCYHQKQSPIPNGTGDFVVVKHTLDTVHFLSAEQFVETGHVLTVNHFVESSTL